MKSLTFKSWREPKGILRLPNGKTLNGFSHCYKTTRHQHAVRPLRGSDRPRTGWPLSEAAATGIPRVHERRDRPAVRRFTSFWITSTLTNPNKTVGWRGTRTCHFHFIPTYSSWLKMVEVWFSILSRQALRNLSCTKIQQLREAIDRFVSADGGSLRVDESLR